MLLTFPFQRVQTHGQVISTQGTNATGYAAVPQQGQPYYAPPHQGQAHYAPPQQGQGQAYYPTQQSQVHYAPPQDQGQAYYPTKGQGEYPQVQPGHPTPQQYGGNQNPEFAKY